MRVVFATITLRDGASARSAAWSLHTARVSGAPVRDRAGNIVGMLSTTDLSALARGQENGEDVRVDEAMTPVVWSVHPDESVISAVRLRVKHGIHRVVVLRGPARIEGILTSMDVLRALAQFEHVGDAFSSGPAGVSSEVDTPSDEDAPGDSVESST